MFKNLLIFLTMACALQANSRPVTDDVIYFLMVDRFANGDKSNDYGKISPDKGPLIHGYLPEDKGYYHGGDLKGVIEKLDYIKGLGATAIWMTPIFTNNPVQGNGKLEGSTSGYHGYWIKDFTTVDPHFGTEADFKKLISEAHKRGIKVFLDIVVNHTADILSYSNCKGDCRYRNITDYPYQGEKNNMNKGFKPGDLSKENFKKLTNPNYAYQVREHPTIKKKPDWLNNPIYYHNRGETSFTGESSTFGDFFGLDDLFTEHPKVVEGMIEIYKEWIRKYEIDGFRVDTVKHVNVEFWQQFVPAIKNYAKELGRPDFFVFGEVFGSNVAELSYYMKQSQMDSVLDFSIHGALNQVFARGQKSEVLYGEYGKDDQYRTAINSPDRLLTFASNHDVGRMGYEIFKSNPNISDDEAISRLKLGYAFLIFSRGIPVIYYGDEQGFTGRGGDRDARHDMFETKVKQYQEDPVIGDTGKNYDQNHPVYKAIAEYNKIYSKHKGLRSGAQSTISSKEKISGKRLDQLTVLTKRALDSDQEFLLAFNSSKRPNEFYLNLKPGQEFKWVYGEENGSEWSYTRKPGQVKVRLAPLSFGILSGQKTTKAFAKNFDAQIVSPVDLGTVGNKFTFEVEASQKGDYEVKFYIQQGKNWQFLGSDNGAPYRVFVDSSKLEVGPFYTVKAVLTNGKGESRTMTAEIEREEPEDERDVNLTLQYLNSNKRTHLHIIKEWGEVLTAKPLKNNQATFNWPKKYGSLFLVFSTKDKDGKISFDRPKLLTPDEVKPFRKEDGQGGVVAKIALDGDLVVRDALSKTPVKTVALPTKASKPLSETLFVRGTMGRWEPRNEVSYLGNYTWETQIKLGDGEHQFKFSDSSWSTPVNFGAPLSDIGFFRNGASKNLTFNVGKNKAGKYRFLFVFYPAKDLPWSSKDVSFYIIENADASKVSH